jgi:hypothetical protein
MGRAATLKVNVVADTKEATAKLDGFSAKTAGIAAGIASAGATLALDALVTGATKAATYLVDAGTAAGDLSAALGTAQKIFGDATGQVTEWSKAAAQGLGLSQKQALATAQTFAVFGQQLGLEGPALAGFTEEVTALAADLGAFADIPTADAVAAIGSAFRGERDPIEKLGIVLNDATVKAAYFAATGEEVTGTLTSQQNIIGTLAAVQQQGAKAAGAFASEQDQLANKTQRNSAEWQNLQDKIGGYVLPVMQALQDAFTTLMPYLETAGDYLVNTLWPALQDLGALIGEKLSPIIDELRKAWEKLEPQLRDVWDRLSELRDTMKPVLDLVGKLAGGAALGLLIAVIGSVVAGLTTFAYILDGLIWVYDRAVKPFIDNAVRGFNTLKDAIGWVIDKVQTVIDFLQRAKDLAGGFLGGIIDKIPGLGRSVIEGAAELGLFGTRTTYSYSPTYVVNAAVPLGVHAGDVGSAIVAEIRRWEARNGPANIGPGAWGN